MFIWRAFLTAKLDSRQPRGFLLAVPLLTRIFDIYSNKWYTTQLSFGCTVFCVYLYMKFRLHVMGLTFDEEKSETSFAENSQISYLFRSNSNVNSSLF